MGFVGTCLQKCQVLKKATNGRSFTNNNFESPHTRFRSPIVNPNKVNIQIKRTEMSTKYYQYQYSCKVEAAVNKQIQAEQQAAQDYLNMAVAFLHPFQSRPGAGGFFMRMFDEEIGHMQDFINYQLTRGGNPIISEITAPKPNINITMLEAFTKALEMERFVTRLLEGVVAAAESEKDYQCADFVTSIFLEEQMRSINEMANHVSKLTKLGCDEHALYHYDLDLSEKYPWKYKRKEPS